MRFPMAATRRSQWPTPRPARRRTSTRRRFRPRSRRMAEFRDARTTAAATRAPRPAASSMPRQSTRPTSGSRRATTRPTTTRSDARETGAGIALPPGRDRLEVNARAELEEALLALIGIAGVAGRRSVGDVAARVLRVEEVEGLEHDLDAVAPRHPKFLADAGVELLERRATAGVDVAHARRKVEREAVVAVWLVESAADVGAGPDHVRRAAVVAVEARDVDAVRCLVDGAEREAMARVVVERAEARVAERIVRIDRHVLDRRAAEVGLVVGGGQAELVGADDDVAGRLRQRVEALQLEIVAEARVHTEVRALVLRLAVPLPDAEVAEMRETTFAGGRVERVRLEAVRQGAIVDVHRFRQEAEPRIGLPRVAERRLIGVRRGDVGRPHFVRRERAERSG